MKFRINKKSPLVSRIEFIQNEDTTYLGEYWIMVYGASGFSINYFSAGPSPTTSGLLHTINRFTKSYRNYYKSDFSYKVKAHPKFKNVWSRISY